MLTNAHALNAIATPCEGTTRVYGWPVNALQECLSQSASANTYMAAFAMKCTCA